MQPLSVLFHHFVIFNENILYVFQRHWNDHLLLGHPIPWPNMPTYLRVGLRLV
jgi:hypothetical protein